MAEEERSGRRHVPWLIAAGVLAAIVVACLWYYYAGRESTDDAQIDGHLTPLAARVGGTIAEVRVVDNQAVEAGALLVRIDPRDYEVALDRAKADLAEASASLTGARSDVPVTSTSTESATRVAESDRASAEAHVQSARARLHEAEAQDKKAAQDVERLKELVAKDEVSRQEYDTVAVAAESAHAARATAEAQLREAEQARAAAEAKVHQALSAPDQVKIVRAKASSAEARVEQTRAAVAQAELELARTQVTAPVAGIVSKKTAEVGQVVQPGQPLLALVSLDDVWVTANFKESQLRDIRPGQPVIVSVDAYGGRKYRAHVDSVSPATGARFSLLPPENASGNYVKVVQRVPVKIVFEPGQISDHLLRPGMSVVPTVLLR